MAKASELKGIRPETPNQRTWTFDLDGEPIAITQWEVAAIVSLREAGEREAQPVPENTQGE